jgi:hypothetical protein
MCPIAMHLDFEAPGVAALLARIPPDMLPGGSDAEAPLVNVMPLVNLALMWLTGATATRRPECTNWPARSSPGPRSPRSG